MPDPVVDGDKSAWANGKRSVDLFEIKMMNSSRYQPLKEGQGGKHFHFGSSHLYFFLSVSQKKDLSHSKLLICFVNPLVVVVTRKHVGWEKKVLFWGERWVEGGERKRP